jgi:hypothetical protein
MFIVVAAMRQQLLCKRHHLHGLVLVWPAAGIEAVIAARYQTIHLTKL